MGPEPELDVLDGEKNAGNLDSFHTEEEISLPPRRNQYLLPWRPGNSRAPVCGQVPGAWCSPRKAAEQG